MKKILVALLLILLIPFVELFAQDEERIPDATLNLRGYKIGVIESPYVVITDALSESLEIVSSPEGTNTPPEIDVTNHIDDLLGNTSSSGFSSDRVVFSYRVVGNTLGSFTLTMTMDDLRLNGTGKEDTDVISTRYDLSNLSYSFHGAYSNEYEGNSISGDTDSEGNTSNDLVSIPSSDDTTLSSKWTVSSTNSSATTTPLAWVHRGAVAMTISSSEYSYDSGHSVGRYVASVEVKLSVTE